MAMQTGDIIYMPGGPAGHIGMAYDERTVIHAQNSKNFHKEADMQMNGGNITYISSSRGVLMFRPPWDRIGNADARKTELQRVADAVAAGATYGIYRAIRLAIGSSTFGPDAYTRWMKYRARYEANKATPANFRNPGHEVIKTVTCSEAVIVCYQLAFPLGEAPFFIRLDGAHALPKTLTTWLAANGWASVR
jgi:hypothetical protein